MPIQKGSVQRRKRRGKETLTRKKPTRQKQERDFWELKLYVSGTTARNVAAFENLKRICDENLSGHCRITVIDLARNPQLAFTAQIIATPTLIKEFPLPLRKIVGDLSNTRRVLAGLDILTRPYVEKI